jgi:hypothetical protein
MVESGLGRRVRHAATLVDLPPSERPAVIRAHLLRAERVAGSKRDAREARHHFGLSSNPSFDEIRQVADRYPVFRVEENYVSQNPLTEWRHDE